MAMRSNPTLFLVTCKGCRETFGNDRKPFALNCSPGHRLCEKCLDDYSRKFCPQCRKPILNRVRKPTKKVPEIKIIFFDRKKIARFSLKKKHGGIKKFNGVLVKISISENNNLYNLNHLILKNLKIY